MKFSPIPPYWWPENAEESKAQFIGLSIMLVLAFSLLMLIAQHENQEVTDWSKRANIQNATIEYTGEGPFPFRKGQYVLTVKGTQNNEAVIYWVQDYNGWTIDKQVNPSTVEQIYSGEKLP